MFSLWVAFMGRQGQNKEEERRIPTLTAWPPGVAVASPVVICEWTCCIPFWPWESMFVLHLQPWRRIGWRRNKSFVVCWISPEKNSNMNDLGSKVTNRQLRPGLMLMAFKYNKNFTLHCSDAIACTSGRLSLWKRFNKQDFSQRLMYVWRLNAKIMDRNNQINSYYLCTVINSSPRQHAHKPRRAVCVRGTESAHNFLKRSTWTKFRN